MQQALDDSELQGALRRLARFARRRTGCPSTADDLVQETLVRLWRRGFTPREFPDSLARVTLHRLWLDGRRRAQASIRRERNAARPERCDLADPAETSERLNSVRDSIAELPEPYRSAMSRRFLRGWDHREIAIASGVRETTVRQRITRGIEMLRGRGELRHLGVGLVAMNAKALAATAAVLVLGGTLALGPTPESVVPKRSGEVAHTGGAEASMLPSAREARVDSPELALDSTRRASMTGLESGAELDSQSTSDERPPTEMPNPHPHWSMISESGSVPGPKSCAGCHGAAETLLAGDSGTEAAASATAASWPPDQDDEPADGWTVEYDDDGNRRGEGEYFTGRRHGRWTMWHPGGRQVSFSGSYVYGLPEGQWRLYRDDGTLVWDAMFRGGLLHGERIGYGEDGETIVERGTYEADEPVGKHLRFHPNGLIAEARTFEHGEVVRTERFDSSGQPIE
ncbi:MAG: sigma-70 family RNA polymerase sigma factor [Planctomycetota bacterium]